MRLIDADILKEVFRRNTGYDYPDIIDNQPTAYDVDKVVGQLERQADNYRGKGFDCDKDGRVDSADRFYARQSAYMDAAQIVRKGGVE